MTTQADHSPQELLCFALAGQDYAIDIMDVREIRGWSTPTALPQTPAYVCGVINLRGMVLPILNLGSRLGLSDAEVSERSVVIVLQVQGRNFGITVDAVSDILTVPGEAIQPPPEGVLGQTDGFLRALCLLEDRMIRVICAETLIPSDAQIAA